MGRRYIGVEQLDYGENDSIERLKNVISGDQTGISKDVKWSKGGSFVSCELLKLNQTYVEKILCCQSDSEINNIWNNIKENAYISYKVDPQSIDKNIDHFNKLNLELKKKFLMEILDKNMLYVPLSELDDVSFEIKNIDKKINISFFNLKS